MNADSEDVRLVGQPAVRGTPEAFAASEPRDSNAGTFLRFLRFGILARGGPIAQIGMLPRELVDEKHWRLGRRATG